MVDTECVLYEVITEFLYGPTDQTNFSLQRVTHIVISHQLYAGYLQTYT